MKPPPLFLTKSFKRSVNPSLKSPSKTSTNTTDEYNYVNSRINFHNTELIKFRSDLSSNELELNEELKILYNDYFNIE